MTTTDHILALAAHAAPTERSAADLVLFTRAVTRGMDSDVLRALRALRPGSLPDSPSWRAWLAATAATVGTATVGTVGTVGTDTAGPVGTADTAGQVGTADTAGQVGTADAAGQVGTADAAGQVGTADAAEITDPSGAGPATALTARFAICAAATALAKDAPAPTGPAPTGPASTRSAFTTASTSPAPNASAASTPPDIYLVAAAVGAGTAAAALVEARLADADGWSVPAVAAVIGAGVAAGIMLRLPEARLRHSLGICATQAAGLLIAAGTSAGPLQAGKAAFNAVEAAHLASLGFTSSRDPLDGRRGLFALFNR